MTKKRQRLKEYINYKLNKYYTVIFTLIIWDFFVFLVFILILCCSKYWPFYISLSSCHRWVFFTSQWTPNYANQLCLMYSKKKTKRCQKLYYFSMKYEYELKNQVGDVKPEEAATCKQIKETLHGFELPLPVTPKTLKYLHTWNSC